MCRERGREEEQGHAVVGARNDGAYREEKEHPGQKLTEEVEGPEARREAPPEHEQGHELEEDDDHRDVDEVSARKELPHSSLASPGGQQGSAP